MQLLTCAAEENDTCPQTHSLCLKHIINTDQRIPKGQSKMDNPVKQATQSTEDEDKQNKNNTQDVLDTTIRKQTQIT